MEALDHDRREPIRAYNRNETFVDPFQRKGNTNGKFLKSVLQMIFLKKNSLQLLGHLKHLKRPDHVFVFLVLKNLGFEPNLNFDDHKPEQFYASIRHFLSQSRRSEDMTEYFLKDFQGKLRVYYKYEDQATTPSFLTRDLECEDVRVVYRFLNWGSIDDYCPIEFFNVLRKSPNLLRVLKRMYKLQSETSQTGKISRMSDSIKSEMVAKYEDKIDRSIFKIVGHFTSLRLLQNTPPKQLINIFASEFDEFKGEFALPVRVCTFENCLNKFVNMFTFD